MDEALDRRLSSLRQRVRSNRLEADAVRAETRRVRVRARAGLVLLQCLLGQHGDEPPQER